VPSAAFDVDPRRLYKYDEIAALAGVTPRQVRRWVERGWLSYVQLPQGRRVGGAHYLAFVAARTVSLEA
jgi:hypothetical protein